MSSDLANVFLAIILHDEIVIIITLPEGSKFQLLHPHKIFMAKTELILDRRIEFVKIARAPFILVTRRIQFDFLATYVELIGVIQCDEVDRHYFVPVSEEYCVYETGLLVLSDCLVPIFNLERSNLSKI